MLQKAYGFRSCAGYAQCPILQYTISVSGMQEENPLSALLAEIRMHFAGLSAAPRGSRRFRFFGLDSPGFSLYYK